MKNKVVIITGASSGIGKALSEEYAKIGAKTVMASRNYKKLEDISYNLKNKGADILLVQTDVSIEADCKNLIDKTVEKYGTIDILINNAGISMRALFKDLDLIVIKRLMDVNFWGTVYCTKYALPYLLKNKGSVVGISSIAGFKGLPGRTGYSASKFAMNGFLETLRIENLKTGLNVLIAAPGFTETNVRKSALTADGSSQEETPREEGQMMSAKRVALHIIKAVKKHRHTLIFTPIGKLEVLVNKFFPKLVDKLSYKYMAKEPDSPFK